jgi:diaminopimelate epimerase
LQFYPIRQGSFAILPKMLLHFTKMQALGNDFVVLDALRDFLPEGFDFSRAARLFCDRHFGVGGDGLLLLDKQNDIVQMRMWNPDGTEDMCGNGLRCIARLAQLRGYAGENFVVDTIAGRREAQIQNDLVRVSMGEPSFDFAQIPMTPLAGPVEYDLPVGGDILPHVTSLSTGSTHTVIFGPLPDEYRFQRLSPQIENHDWFPERTSVLWAQIVAQNIIQLRIWERGVGETLACGTGACAAGVAAQLTGRATSPLSVQSKGGTLRIEWQPGQEIFKTGPAQVVYEGEIES